MRALRSLLPALALTLLGAPLTALAHTDAHLDKQPAPNGGQMRMAGAYHFELVVARDAVAGRDSPLTVYVTDHGGNKVPTAGAKGSVTLLSGKSKLTAPLQPDGDNRLRGSAAYLASPALKAAVSVTLPGKPTEQALFTPLATPAATPTPAAKHHHH